MIMRKKPHPNMYRILAKYFEDIPEDFLNNVAAMVVLGEEDVISTIYPTPGHVVMAGWGRDVNEALNEVDEGVSPIDSFNTGYYFNPSTSLAKAEYGGYIWVGPGFVMHDIHPGDRKAIVTINWNPDNIDPPNDHEEPVASLFTSGEDSLMSFIDMVQKAAGNRK